MNSKLSSEDCLSAHTAFFQTLGADNLEEALLKYLNDSKNGREKVDFARYRPLCKHIQANDWKEVEDFIKEHPETLGAKITEFGGTVFHKIVNRGETAIPLLKKLVSQVSPSYLEEKVLDGNTALVNAAIVGCKEAAKLFVDANKSLPNLKNDSNFYPIHHAATFGHKETVLYLLSVTETDSRESFFGGESGFSLLELLIESNLFGLALSLLKSYSRLADAARRNPNRVLGKLAKKPGAFASGCHLGYWDSIIYQYIPVKEENFTRRNDLSAPEYEDGDMENPVEKPKNCSAEAIASGFLQSIGIDASGREFSNKIWNVLTNLVPRIRHIHDLKLKHTQTVEIVRMMCAGMTWSYEEAIKLLKKPLFTAARLGIYEFIDEILKEDIVPVSFFDEDKHNIFDVAVIYRHEKVFNLIYKVAVGRNWLTGFKDKSGCNILHLAGRLVPSSQVSGAALQMQRELQWFKAVKKLFRPTLQEELNAQNKTPREVFTEQHQHLVKEGEKWMKNTAHSCTVVGALIITVAFAAAFTVPGGNNCNEGIPIFLHKPSFIVFVVSDALALFSSTASVLMFLAILTSRYSEKDFLKSLPNKLVIGLITLFVSIASMTVAYSATIYIFLTKPWKWTMIPISLLGFLPVTLFAQLQFHLMVEMYLSTYGPSIFQPPKQCSASSHPHHFGMSSRIRKSNSF